MGGLSQPYGYAFDPNAAELGGLNGFANAGSVVAVAGQYGALTIINPIGIANGLVVTGFSCFECAGAALLYWWDVGLSGVPPGEKYDAFGKTVVRVAPGTYEQAGSSMFMYAGTLTQASPPDDVQPALWALQVGQDYFPPKPFYVAPGWGLCLVSTVADAGFGVCFDWYEPGEQQNYYFA